MAGEPARADQSLITKASQAYRSAIAINPGDATLHANYSLILATARKFPDAISSTFAAG